MPRRLVGDRMLEVPSFEMGPEIGASEFSPEEMSMIERLERAYPDVTGQIHTKEDLDTVLKNLPGEDDAA